MIQLRNVLEKINNEVETQYIHDQNLEVWGDSFSQKKIVMCKKKEMGNIEF